MGLWLGHAFNAVTGSIHLCLSFHFLLSFLISLLLAPIVITASGRWDVKQLLLIVFAKWLGHRIVEVSSESDPIKNQLWEQSFSVSCQSGQFVTVGGGALVELQTHSSPPPPIVAGLHFLSLFFFFWRVPWSEIEPWLNPGAHSSESLKWS